MDSAGYARLEKNLIDIIMEQQMKLGYCDEEVRLYYPLSSLNHFFGMDDSSEAMLAKLSSAQLRERFREKLGEVEITQSNGRFCFLIPKEGGKYVHENVAQDKFLGELISYVGMHGCTMDGIFDLFYKYSKSVAIQKAEDDEFDYVVHFEHGKDADDKDSAVNIDEYYYCFKDEGCHIIYHRFLPEDYKDLFKIG